MARRFAIDAVIVLLLAGAVWLLYGPVLRLWWMYDDSFHLRYLLTQRPFWYLFDASGYRGFPGQSLTPLLFASLDADRRLFGIEPALFYAHQLTALSCCTAALYVAQRLWLARTWAAAGAMIFLAGPVTASLAPLLMVRHYIEAVLLLALAVVAWAGASRRLPTASAWGLAGASAALYFAASMTKEFAVPLFLLLPLLPATGIRQPALRDRLLLTLPHAVAFLVYLGLRQVALGTLLGGYGFAVRPLDLPGLALRLPAKIAAEFVARQHSSAAALLALALVAGALALLLHRRRRAAALVGSGLLLAVLPFVAVSTQMEPRMAFPAWTIAALAFAAGCASLAAAAGTTRRAAFALALVGCVSGLWLNRQDWRDRFAQAERMSAENRFILNLRQGDVLRQPLTLAASLREVEWMKQEVFHLPAGGTWFQDDLHLCLRPGPLGRVWGYDTADRRVEDLTAEVPALRERHCSALRHHAPLTASFRVADGNLFWDLGPYEEGTYRFVLDDGGQVFEMPRSAGFQVPALPPLRIGYESPDGWVTYSPELHLRHEEGWSFRWLRPETAQGLPVRANEQPRQMKSFGASSMP